MGQRENVIEIARNLARRLEAGRDFPARRLGDRLRKETGLNLAPNLQLPLVAQQRRLPLAQAAVVHRHRRLRGQRLGHQLLVGAKGDRVPGLRVPGIAQLQHAQTLLFCSGTVRQEMVR